jgi:hypothetical protein
MLKRDPNGRFVCRTRGVFRKKLSWHFETGRLQGDDELTDEHYAQLRAQQERFPTVVMQDVASKRKWWMFRGEFYWENEELQSQDVLVLILDKADQKEKRLQRAAARLQQSRAMVSAGREPIPDDVKIFVWQRDRGQCTRCGSAEKLEFDHVIPIAMGGGNTARNLQLLCEACNRRKGAGL